MVFSPHLLLVLLALLAVLPLSSPFIFDRLHRHQYLQSSLLATFVTMPSDSDEPKSKKLKASKKGEEEEEEAEGVKRNDDGEAYFDLAAKRRVTVRQWNKKVLVDIREVGACDVPFVIFSFYSPRKYILFICMLLYY